MGSKPSKYNSVHLNPDVQRPVKTERPEGIEAGTNKDTIVELLDKPLVYEKMSKAVNPYGDGKAVERIYASQKKQKVEEVACGVLFFNVFLCCHLQLFYH